MTTDKKHFQNTDNASLSICSKTKISFPFLLFVSLFENKGKSSVHITILQGSFSKIRASSYQAKKKFKKKIYLCANIN